MQMHCSQFFMQTHCIYTLLDNNNCYFVTTIICFLNFEHYCSKLLLLLRLLLLMARRNLFNLRQWRYDGRGWHRWQCFRFRFLRTSSISIREARFSISRRNARWRQPVFCCGMIGAAVHGGIGFIPNIGLSFLCF